MTVVRKAQGTPLRVLGDELRVLQRSADSENRMAVMQVEVPPGSGVPPHSHATEEEAYYVLDGSLTMLIDGTEYELEPGDYAHVAPGVAHGYRNRGTQATRFLAWTIGGAIDQFFAAMSREVRRMPEDAAAMQGLMERFGVRPV